MLGYGADDLVVTFISCHLLLCCCTDTNDSFCTLGRLGRVHPTPNKNTINTTTKLCKIKTKFWTWSSCNSCVGGTLISNHSLPRPSTYLQHMMILEPQPPHAYLFLGRVNKVRNTETTNSWSVESPYLIIRKKKNQFNILFDKTI